MVPFPVWEYYDGYKNVEQKSNDKEVYFTISPFYNRLDSSVSYKPIKKDRIVKLYLVWKRYYTIDLIISMRQVIITKEKMANRM